MHFVHCSSEPTTTVTTSATTTTTPATTTSPTTTVTEEVTTTVTTTASTTFVEETTTVTTTTPESSTTQTTTTMTTTRECYDVLTEELTQDSPRSYTVRLPSGTADISAIKVTPNISGVQSVSLSVEVTTDGENYEDVTSKTDLLARNVEDEQGNIIGTERYVQVDGTGTVEISFSERLTSSRAVRIIFTEDRDITSMTLHGCNESLVTTTTTTVPETTTPSTTSEPSTTVTTSATTTTTPATTASPTTTVTEEMTTTVTTTASTTVVEETTTVTTTTPESSTTQTTSTMTITRECYDVLTEELTQDSPRSYTVRLPSGTADISAIKVTPNISGVQSVSLSVEVTTDGENYEDVTSKTDLLARNVEDEQGNIIGTERYVQVDGTGTVEISFSERLTSSRAVRIIFTEDRDITSMTLHGCNESLVATTTTTVPETTTPPTTSEASTTVTTSATTTTTPATTTSPTTTVTEEMTTTVTTTASTTVVEETTTVTTTTPESSTTQTTTTMTTTRECYDVLTEELTQDSPRSYTVRLPSGTADISAIKVTPNISGVQSVSLSVEVTTDGENYEDVTSKTDLLARNVEDEQGNIIGTERYIQVDGTGTVEISFSERLTSSRAVRIIFTEDRDITSMTLHGCNESLVTTTTTTVPETTTPSTTSEPTTTVTTSATTTTTPATTTSPSTTVTEEMTTTVTTTASTTVVEEATTVTTNTPESSTTQTTTTMTITRECYDVLTEELTQDSPRSYTVRLPSGTADISAIKVTPNISGVQSVSLSVEVTTDGENYEDVTSKTDLLARNVEDEQGNIIGTERYIQVDGTGTVEISFSERLTSSRAVRIIFTEDRDITSMTLHGCNESLVATTTTTVPETTTPSTTSEASTTVTTSATTTTTPATTTSPTTTVTEEMTTTVTTTASTTVVEETTTVTTTTPESSTTQTTTTMTTTRECYDVLTEELTQDSPRSYTVRLPSGTADISAIKVTPNISGVQSVSLSVEVTTDGENYEDVTSKTDLLARNVEDEQGNIIGTERYIQVDGTGTVEISFSERLTSSRAVRIIFTEDRDITSMTLHGCNESLVTTTTTTVPETTTPSTTSEPTTTVTTSATTTTTPATTTSPSTTVTEEMTTTVTTTASTTVVEETTTVTTNTPESSTTQTTTTMTITRECYDVLTEELTQDSPRSYTVRLPSGTADISAIKVTPNISGVQSVSLSVEVTTDGENYEDVTSKTDLLARNVEDEQGNIIGTERYVQVDGTGTVEISFSERLTSSRAVRIIFTEDRDITSMTLHGCNESLVATTTTTVPETTTPSTTSEPSTTVTTSATTTTTPATTTSPTTTVTEEMTTTVTTTASTTVVEETTTVTTTTPESSTTQTTTTMTTTRECYDVLTEELTQDSPRSYTVRLPSGTADISAIKVTPNISGVQSVSLSVEVTTDGENYEDVTSLVTTTTTTVPETTTPSTTSEPTTTVTTSATTTTTPATTTSPSTTVTEEMTTTVTTTASTTVVEETTTVTTNTPESSTTQTTTTMTTTRECYDVLTEELTQDSPRSYTVRLPSGTADISAIKVTPNISGVQSVSLSVEVTTDGENYEDVTSKTDLLARNVEDEQGNIIGTERYVQVDGTGTVEISFSERLTSSRAVRIIFTEDRDITSMTLHGCNESLVTTTTTTVPETTTPSTTSEPTTTVTTSATTTTTPATTTSPTTTVTEEMTTTVTTTASTTVVEETTTVTTTTPESSTTQTTTTMSTTRECYDVLTEELTQDSPRSYTVRLPSGTADISAIKVTPNISGVQSVSLSVEVTTDGENYEDVTSKTDLLARNVEDEQGNIIGTERYVQVDGTGTVEISFSERITSSRAVRIIFTEDRDITSMTLHGCNESLVTTTTTTVPETTTPSTTSEPTTTVTTSATTTTTPATTTSPTTTVTEEMTTTVTTTASTTVVEETTTVTTTTPESSTTQTTTTMTITRECYDVLTEELTQDSPRSYTVRLPSGTADISAIKVTPNISGVQSVSLTVEVTTDGENYEDVTSKTDLLARNVEDEQGNIIGTERYVQVDGTGTVEISFSERLTSSRAVRIIFTEDRDITSMTLHGCNESLVTTTTTTVPETTTPSTTSEPTTTVTTSATTTTTPATTTSPTTTVTEEMTTTVTTTASTTVVEETTTVTTTTPESSTTQTTTTMTITRECYDVLTEELTQDSPRSYTVRLPSGTADISAIKVTPNISGVQSVSLSVEVTTDGENYEDVTSKTDLLARNVEDEQGNIIGTERYVQVDGTGTVEISFSERLTSSRAVRIIFTEDRDITSMTLHGCNESLVTTTTTTVPETTTPSTTSEPTTTVTTSATTTTTPATSTSPTTTVTEEMTTTVTTTASTTVVEETTTVTTTTPESSTTQTTTTTRECYDVLTEELTQDSPRSYTVRLPSGTADISAIKVTPNISGVQSVSLSVEVTTDGENYEDVTSKTDLLARNIEDEQGNIIGTERYVQVDGTGTVEISFSERLTSSRAVRIIFTEDRDITSMTLHGCNESLVTTTTTTVPETTTPSTTSEPTTTVTTSATTTTTPATTTSPTTTVTEEMTTTVTTTASTTVVEETTTVTTTTPESSTTQTTATMTITRECYDVLTEELTQDSPRSYTVRLPSGTADISAIKVTPNISGVQSVSLSVEVTTDGENYEDVTSKTDLLARNVEDEQGNIIGTERYVQVDGTGTVEISFSERLTSSRAVRIIFTEDRDITSMTLHGCNESLVTTTTTTVPETTTPSTTSEPTTTVTTSATTTTTPATTTSPTTTVTEEMTTTVTTTASTTVVEETTTVTTTTPESSTTQTTTTMTTTRGSKNCYDVLTEELTQDSPRSYTVRLPSGTADISAIKVTPNISGVQSVSLSVEVTTDGENYEDVTSKTDLLARNVEDEQGNIIGTERYVQVDGTGTVEISFSERLTSSRAVRIIFTEDKDITSMTLHGCNESLVTTTTTTVPETTTPSTTSEPTTTVTTSATTTTTPATTTSPTTTVTEEMTTTVTTTASTTVVEETTTVTTTTPESSTTQTTTTMKTTRGSKNCYDVLTEELTQDSPRSYTVRLPSGTADISAIKVTPNISGVQSVSLSVEVTTDGENYEDVTSKTDLLARNVEDEQGNIIGTERYVQVDGTGTVEISFSERLTSSRAVRIIFTEDKDITSMTLHGCNESLDTTTTTTVPETTTPSTTSEPTTTVTTSATTTTTPATTTSPTTTVTEEMTTTVTTTASTTVVEETTTVTTTTPESSTTQTTTTMTTTRDCYDVLTEELTQDSPRSYTVRLPSGTADISAIKVTPNISGVQSVSLTVEVTTDGENYEDVTSKTDLLARNVEDEQGNIIGTERYVQVDGTGTVEISFSERLTSSRAVRIIFTEDRDITSMTLHGCNESLVTTTTTTVPETTTPSTTSELTTTVTTSATTTTTPATTTSPTTTVTEEMTTTVTTTASTTVVEETTTVTTTTPESSTTQTTTTMTTTRDCYDVLTEELTQDSPRSYTVRLPSGTADISAIKVTPNISGVQSVSLSVEVTTDGENYEDVTSLVTTTTTTVPETTTPSTTSEPTTTVTTSVTTTTTPATTTSPTTTVTEEMTTTVTTTASTTVVEETTTVTTTTPESSTTQTTATMTITRDCYDVLTEELTQDSPRSYTVRLPSGTADISAIKVTPNISGVQSVSLSVEVTTDGENYEDVTSKTDLLARNVEDEQGNIIGTERYVQVDGTGTVEISFSERLTSSRAVRILFTEDRDITSMTLHGCNESLDTTTTTTVPETTTPSTTSEPTTTVTTSATTTTTPATTTSPTTTVTEEMTTTVTTTASTTVVEETTTVTTTTPESSTTQTTTTMTTTRDCYDVLTEELTQDSPRSYTVRLPSGTADISAIKVTPNISGVQSVSLSVEVTTDGENYEDVTSKTDLLARNVEDEQGNIIGTERYVQVDGTGTVEISFSERLTSSRAVRILFTEDRDITSMTLHGCNESLDTTTTTTVPETTTPSTTSEPTTTVTTSATTTTTPATTTSPTTTVTEEMTTTVTTTASTTVVEETTTVTTTTPESSTTQTTTTMTTTRECYDVLTEELTQDSPRSYTVRLPSGTADISAIKVTPNISGVQSVSLSVEVTTDGENYEDVTRKYHWD
ncbi:mucin-2-like [Lytechinus pictus]|uniref:mucin-2-like n=1 Tax=Lytechinus pictus TaxID=7653 RepID=UPI0030B9DB36